jgi:hypothetical protein
MDPTLGMAQTDPLNKIDDEIWTRLSSSSVLRCVFTSLKTPKMKSVLSLVAMQKKDLTRKLVIVFHITFPIYPLTSLNVSGHVI